MSEQAFKKYEQALNEQHTRNEARRIRTRVAEARRNPHSAGIRWPFELLQNALDAGPRSGSTSVTIRLQREAGKVIFEHDGAPFTYSELAALLSGGSSKEFESDVTTGRFGTGFLVTHVLADKTMLRGLLQVETGCEQFTLTLDRSGDEDAILASIGLCNDAIRHAVPVASPDHIPSARFEYHTTDESSLLLGLDSLRKSLPYLYATRPNLGRVEIQIENLTKEIWSPEPPRRLESAYGVPECRAIIVTQNKVPERHLRVFRFLTTPDSPAGALVLVEDFEDSTEVVLPDLISPKIYREYPLRGSGFLPTAFVLEGKFEPDQERLRLLMSDKDKLLIEQAFAAAIGGVRYAIDQKWKQAHLLAQSRPPTTAFDPTDENEISFWTGQLASFANSLAHSPIVHCTQGYLPGISEEEEFADFVVARLLDNSSEDETTVERMWPLVKAAKKLSPPLANLATDWTQISEGWHTLGLDLSRVSLSRLAQVVREEATIVSELNIEGDSLAWLTAFLDLVGECWERRNGVEFSVLNRMLPNQNGRLCSPSELRQDASISERLKDICSEIGLDIRSELLFNGFKSIAESLSLANVSTVIDKAVRESVSDSDLTQRALGTLLQKLPEDKDCPESTFTLQHASVKLLQFLWESKGNAGASVARQIPLITSKNRSVRWSPDRMMMAPVCSWSESAQPFAGAYPPHRVLSNLYAGVEEASIPNCVPALVDWNIAIPDPISTDSPVELKDRRLEVISPDSANVTITGETFSQIALLQPEVLNRCQESVEEAGALLGLVLCHVAPHDPAWQEIRTVKGKKGREEMEVSVRGALWLADLKFRAWVPVPGEDGKPQKVVANPSSLGPLLDPSWLERNDAAIKLLSEWFDFDALELRLLGIEPDSDKRRQLRDSLAKIVELGGADPTFYSSLAAEIEASKRKSLDVDRCRRLGIAVQEAVKSAMEAHGLALTLVDRGFDYEVTPSNDDVLQDSSTRFEIDTYLLEVKATTTGEPRLTPTQAKVASVESSRYLLCVVDLRGLSEDDLDGAWTAERVIPLTKIVSDIGTVVQRTHQLVEQAKSSSVPITGETALRYNLPLSVWDNGISITNWVSKTWVR